MRKNKMIISILFLCFMNLIVLTGCGNNSNSNEDTKEKVSQQLDYLDTRIVNILNQLNNISLQNYNVTSEEVELSQTSSSSGGSSSSGEGESSGSSGASRTRKTI